MSYEHLEIYIDNSTNKANSGRNKSTESQKHRDLSPSEESDLVKSCMRVITEGTDYTSNHLSNNQSK